MRALAAAALLAGCASSAPVALPAASVRALAPAEESEGGDEAEEPFEPGAESHAIGVFVGGSGETGDRDGITVGLDYGYRVTDEVGIGTFAEFVSGLDRSFATGGQAYWVSPIDLVLFAGVGVERRNDEWEPIFRVGIEYEIIQPSGWAVAPSIFYDWGEEAELVVYGVTFGRFL